MYGLLDFVLVNNDKLCILFASWILFWWLVSRGLKSELFPLLSEKKRLDMDRSGLRVSMHEHPSQSWRGWWLPRHQTEAETTERASLNAASVPIQSKAPPANSGDRSSPSVHVQLTPAPKNMWPGGRGFGRRARAELAVGCGRVVLVHVLPLATFPGRDRFSDAPAPACILLGDQFNRSCCEKKIKNNRSKFLSFLGLLLEPAGAPGLNEPTR
jgi:hypothetical protein